MNIIAKIQARRSLNKHNLECIDNLNNEGMLDNVIVSFKRFKSINRLMVENYSSYYVWRRWLVR